MKIGFFTDSYRPYISGVVKSIESFTNHLRARGHEVYIFAPDYPSREENEDYIYRYRSLPTFNGTNFRLAIPLTKKLLSRVDRFGLDIVHTHSPFLLGWLGKVIAHRYDFPLIFTHHTLYEKYAHYAPFAPSLAKKMTVNYINKYCSACSLVITPSDYVQQELKKKDISVPMITIPTGIEIDEYRGRKEAKIRKQYGIDEQERVLLFVGRLGEEKNVEFLMTTFRKIESRISNVKLMFVGDGPCRNKLMKIRNRYGLQKKVIFTGWQSPEKVIDFYLAGDLFVFPSETETQGLVTLEAMGAGLPVVAVRASGSTEMIDNGIEGFLVEADGDIFSAAVIKILTHDNLYNNFAHNARLKAEKYSMSHMTDKLIKTYTALKAEKAGYNKYLA